MKISEFSVKHSLLVNLISVFILIAGFYTIFISRIRKEAFPEVSFDRVIIKTVYPGATPEEVEKLVTTPIEKELRGVDGIEEIDSTSIDNASTISVEISEDVKNKPKVINDIQQAGINYSGRPTAAKTCIAYHCYNFSGPHAYSLWNLGRRPFPAANGAYHYLGHHLRNSLNVNCNPLYLCSH